MLFKDWKLRKLLFFLGLEVKIRMWEFFRVYEQVLFIVVVFGRKYEFMVCQFVSLQWEFLFSFCCSSIFIVIIVVSWLGQFYFFFVCYCCIRIFFCQKLIRIQLVRVWEMQFFIQRRVWLEGSGFDISRLYLVQRFGKVGGMM